MSWHCLRAPGEACSDPRCSVIPQCASLRSTPTADPCCSHASGTECCRDSRSGTTCGPSTGDRGGVQLTLFQEASPASRSAPRPAGGTARQTSGLRCAASSTSAGRDGCSPKTSPRPRSEAPPPTSVQTVTVVGSPVSARPTWLASIVESDGGLLATPTAKANQWAPSMSKWPGCRALQRLCGPETRASAFEWMMGWPIGWTELEPLVTVKYQRWLRSHGACSQDKTVK